jgi:hypothetical protein
MNGTEKNIRRISARMSEGKRGLGRSMLRWKYNIKINVNQIESEILNYVNLAQDREKWVALVNTFINIRFS